MRHAAFGADGAEGMARLGKRRRVLRRDPEGVGKATGALPRLPRKGRGSADIAREPGFFRRNGRRMNRGEAGDAGRPIGSGAAEAANKVPGSIRMKRSGQRRSRDGGRGVPAFRSLPEPDRLGRAWAAIAATWQTWKPPAAANDSRALARAA